MQSFRFTSETAFGDSPNLMRPLKHPLQRLSSSTWPPCVSIKIGTSRFELCRITARPSALRRGRGPPRPWRAKKVDSLAPRLMASRMRPQPPPRELFRIEFSFFGHKGQEKTGEYRQKSSFAASPHCARKKYLVQYLPATRRDTVEAAQGRAKVRP